MKLKYVKVYVKIQSFGQNYENKKCLLIVLLCYGFVDKFTGMGVNENWSKSSGKEN